MKKEIDKGDEMYNCEILNMYDVNKDGIIDTPELQYAVADKIAGRITAADYSGVERVWADDVNIRKVCPPQQAQNTLVLGCVVAAILFYILMR